ncbi:beta strand repeat-containing protein [Massilia sp. LXY-6]|uniref:beta strand repeat-containing protein n=1 Tax=Massilia sp. LXY-6 TaxID=3379823 RepID=UPI003EE24258
MITASVSGNKLTVVGIAPGTVNVAITDSAGAKVTVAMTTTNSQALFSTAPAQVSITPGTSSVYTIGGGSGAYTAISSNPNVITTSVSGNSLTVVGVAPGTANVAITDAAGAKVTIAVTTTNSQALFSTAPAQVSITPGTSSVYTIGGGSGAYTAISSNPNVITTSVSGNSLTVVGVAPGTANVAITDAVGGKVTIAVTTTNSQALFSTAPAQVSITPGTSSVYAIGGGSGTYTAASSNTNVVTASVNGNSLTVVGIAPGTANVTITDAAGGKVTIAVTTMNSQALFTTAAGQVSIVPGNSTVYAIGGGNGPYSATSSNTSVATASVSGTSLTVQAIAAGAATIIVTDTAGHQVPITVKTSSSEALFTTAPTQVSITPGTSAVYAIGGGSVPYSATSSDTNVAKVKISGTSMTIDSIKAGTATITVTDSAGKFVPIIVAFDDPLFITAPTDITLPYAGAASYLIAGGVPPYTASSSSPTVVTASVSGTSLNVTPQWQQSSPSTPATVTVVDAKGRRVQTNVTVLGRGQSGSIPAILPASITVSDCTTNIPFVFFGGTPPFTVYSGDNSHVPVSAALPFGTNWYFTASVRVLPFSALVPDPFRTTLTVVDSQSKTATVEVLVPGSSVRTCPSNPILEVVAGSTVAKETEQISFQITGGTPPYKVESKNFLPFNTSQAYISTPTGDLPGNSFIATALSTGSAVTGELTGTAMITVISRDGQQKNVVLTVYPQPKP